jgi:hypothetical protein
MVDINLLESVIRENIKLKDNLEKITIELNNAKEENEKLIERLKKYTAPSRNKKYYEKHKEEIKAKVLSKYHATK